MCAASLSAQPIKGRTNVLALPHWCEQVMQEVGQEVEGYMTSMFGKDRPDKDAEVVFLTKFIVKPEIALDFIGAIKKVCKGPCRCTALAACPRLAAAACRSLLNMQVQAALSTCILKVCFCFPQLKSAALETDGVEIYALSKTKVRATQCGQYEVL